jgi:hypothetical protein
MASVNHFTLRHTQAPALRRTWTSRMPPLARPAQQRRGHIETASYAYLDLSNLFVGATQVSAARLGLAASPADAAERGISDQRLRINFGAIRDFLVGTSSTGARCIAFGSIKDENDIRLANGLRRNGFEARMLRRSAAGREKAVDTSLSVTMLEELLLGDSDGRVRDVTLVSGDRDMSSIVEALLRHDIEVDVAAWEHTASPVLVGLARRFIALDDYFQLITYRAEQR